MARQKSSSQSPPAPYLKVARAELDRQLQARIREGRYLLERPEPSNYTQDGLKAARDDYYTWHDYNVTLLERSFSTSTPADDYKEWIGIAGGTHDLREQVEEFHEDVRRYVRRLVSLKERLELYDEIPVVPESQAARSTRGGEAAVFVVHGRSEGPKHEVARFVERVSPLKCIILHEQPNSGRTLIEKFEHYATPAAFAVVLLTGDDEGRLVGSGQWNRRARQNVVFELGFFIGKLGRDRVAVLYEETVDLPSDMKGLLYTPLDSGGAGRMSLAREMQQARLDVDFNRVL